MNKKSQNIFLEENEEFMIGFISGFIDSDGYVAKGDIVISNINKKLLEITKLWCEKLNVNTKLWRQDNDINCKKFKIWRLRVGARFKYEEHYSRKILRVYGGGNSPTSHHSEYLSGRIDTYKGGVVRKSRRAHNP